MAKKKNKTELAPPAPAPVRDDPLPAAEAPAPPPVEAPALEPSASAPVPSPPEPVPAFLIEAGPELAPAQPPEPPKEEPPQHQDKPQIDLVMADAPLAEPAPMALLAPDPLIETLLERIRRLEESLAQFQNLQAIEQRVVDRVTTQLQREKPVAQPASPSALSTAVALLDAGKTLLPALALPASPPAQPPPPQAPPAVHRVWLLWDILAEARTIVRMYVDPRYRMSWLGRTLPLALFAAFVTTQWWMPLGSLPVLGWIPVKVAEVVLGFLLFKVLGHEARRYRETAPDLPPTLRL